MKWQWISHRGKNNTKNRDAGGIIINEYFIFAIIVDGSNKGESGEKFVNEWIKHVLDKIIQLTTVTKTDVIKCMKSAQNKLRTKYILESASYSALLMLKNTNQTWGFNCGDCRIGKLINDKIEWLSQDHTLANTFSKEISIYSGVVTRTLNAKRFIEPDIIEIDYCFTESLFLATDGYWRIPSKIGLDDTSKLTLSHTLKSTFVDTDTCNWYEIKK